MADEPTDKILEFAYKYIDEHPELFERLRVAHTCEADETGRIEDCPFGGEGHDFEEAPFRCKHTLEECRNVMVSGSRCCIMCNGHDPVS